MKTETGQIATLFSSTICNAATRSRTSCGGAILAGLCFLSLGCVRVIDTMDAPAHYDAGSYLSLETDSGARWDGDSTEPVEVALDSDSSEVAADNGLSEVAVDGGPSEVADLVSWDCSWSSRIKITFDNSKQNENLINFPVLVILDSSRIDYTKTRDLGQDIRFVDADGATVLAHEIEKWNEHGKSLVWVKVPQVDGSSSTDFIWMYYNNSSASDAQDAAGVWDNNYVGVWHLDENGGGKPDEFGDSSGKGNHGQGGSGAANEVPTQITTGMAGAQSFDSTDDHVAIAHSESLNIENDITVTAWVKRTEENWVAILTKTDFCSRWDYQFLIAVDNSLGFWADDASPILVNSKTTIKDTNWHYVAASRAGTNVRFYIDGVDAGGGGTMIGSLNDSAFPVILGYDGEDDSAIDGILDEVRLSCQARSADWIAAQYLSMTDSLLTFDAEQKSADYCP